MERIVFVLTDRTVLLDVTGPLQAFHDANQLIRTGKLPFPGVETSNGNDDATDAPFYEIILASADGGAIKTDTGIAIETVPLTQAAAKPIDTLIVAGADDDLHALENAALVSWLRVQKSAVRRTGSICIGALLLGAAGYLDGRRAVTHWQWCDRLQARFPAARIERDPIFIEDDRVWTSAGVTTGIDMAIAMIERDLGRAFALAVARGLIMFIKRPGTQSQFEGPLDHQTRDTSGRFDHLHTWMRAHLDHRLNVEELAEVANMSSRNFSRVYAQITGLSPARSVEMMRMTVARQKLETGEQSIAQIALECGFGDDERMRRCFVKHLGVPPADYRARFATNNPAPHRA